MWPIEQAAGDGVSDQDLSSDELDDDEDEYEDEPEEAGHVGESEAPSAAGAKTPRAQRPKKVPRGTLQAAVALATTMWGTAGKGSESAEAVARLFGHETTNSSSFRNKLALMRIWGLIEGSDPMKLSDIGLDIIRDDEPERQAQARRRAFYTPKAFRKLVEAYDGRSLPAEADLATKCRFDFHLTEEASLEVARVFRQSLPFAGLMSSDGIVHKGGAATTDTLQTELEGGDGARAVERASGGTEGDSGGGEVDDLEPPKPAAESTQKEPQAVAPQLERVEAGMHEVPGARAVEVTVRLTGYTGDEVVEILRTIGYGNVQD